MLRLTLRSGRDGRMLARVIDRGGDAFVLDYGDPVVVRDVSRRLLRGGFSVWRGGTWVTATPRHPEMIHLLASYYCCEGLLVFLDEPTWPGRSVDLEEILPSPAGIREVDPMDALDRVGIDGHDDDDDDETEYAKRPHRHQPLDANGPARTTWTPPGAPTDDLEDDEPTEFMVKPVRET